MLNAMQGTGRHAAATRPMHQRGKCWLRPLICAAGQEATQNRRVGRRWYYVEEKPRKTPKVEPAGEGREASELGTR
jgi:hypothetical protein